LPISAEQVVLSFVEKINQADISGLALLLGPDQKFVEFEGERSRDSRDRVRDWQNYLNDNPNYRIYLQRIYKSGIKVILIGHTTGSHLDLEDIVEFHSEGVIWIAKVNEEKITHWQLIKDTLENYNLLGLDEFTRLFHPAHYAATIAKHLDLLPPGSRTEDVRNVRKFYSRLYRDADPEDLLLLAETLLFEEGYRFVPYEMIYYHPGAINALSPDRVTALGQGINDWSSADIYAHFIAGPAWKEGVISDTHIDDWISSDDLWWRRTAVVSTIYLDGDIAKMLRYTKYLLDDREDLIVKALSWVLRSAIKYDRSAVIDFLDAHNDRLAPRIKREVGHKLTTGLKNP